MGREGETEAARVCGEREAAADAVFPSGSWVAAGGGERGGGLEGAAEVGGGGDEGHRRV